MTVDVGDHIQGGTIGVISSGEAIIKIMNQIKAKFELARVENS